MKKEFQISILLLCYVINTVYSQCKLAQVCVHDRIVDECNVWIGEVLVPGAAVHGCCPGCAVPPVGGENPGLTTGECRPPYTCLENGKYAPVQCKGDQFTGRCFCYNENGTRIFGQMWRNEASEMTCACSLRRHQLENSGNRVVTLHCTPSGDYEPLQCDDGMCWCAEPKTGQPTVIPVPEENMTLLPCYDSFDVGSQYLRQCESSLAAHTRIRQEQSEHGTNFLGAITSLCDYDGSYGAYRVQNGIATCIGPDGKVLGSWAVVTGTDAMSTMTCNCARDTMVYFPARGMTVTETCAVNGNYMPNQNVNGVYYCVDRDGYPVTDFLDAWPPGDCSNFA